MKGVIILATGHSIYGRYALNLAISLRANCHNVDICLVCDKQGIADFKEYQLNLFNTIKIIDESSYIINGEKHHFFLKTKLYELSPYDETIFFDADTLICPGKNIDFMFSTLSDNDFAIANNGWVDLITGKSNVINSYKFWGEIEAIKEYHKITKLYQTNSTFIYFKKTQENKELFDLCQQIYLDESAPKEKQTWGYADEYCFNVALSKLNIKFKSPNQNIIFIQFVQKKIEKKNITERFWGMTNGGHKTHPLLVKIYNELVNQYCLKMNILDRFYHIDKSQLIPERNVNYGTIINESL